MLNLGEGLGSMTQYEDLEIHALELRNHTLGRRRRPLGADPEIGKNHLRTVIPSKSCYISAWMARCAAQIQPTQVSSVMACALERSVVSHLSVSECAD